MRLDRLWVDGLRNLRNLTIDFDEQQLTTVIIGQNGAGKSNLIEAIVAVFRDFDLNDPPRFSCKLDYSIRNHRVQLAGVEGKWRITVDGDLTARAAFLRQKHELLPDLVFGYYSGAGRRLEALFDAHQRKYYGDIIEESAGKNEASPIEQRRMFFCRPIHGIHALLSFFARPDPEVMAQLAEMLDITGFHSALFLFSKPWFGNAKRRRDPTDFWGAKGLPGASARRLREHGFYPLTRTERVVDDYRDKGTSEEQFCVFLRDEAALKDFAAAYGSDLEMFDALESMDISDLIRSVDVWVKRTDDKSGEVNFTDLSDGEKQLLMVLGLIRLSRGLEAVFLLDEPDTHLNPAWQYQYLDLLRNWAKVDPSKCHLILTTHNPITIASLTRSEVRVMDTNADGRVTAEPPYVDPRGMGFTATLTEIFGLPSTVDADTQRKLDRRNVLVAKSGKSEAETLEWHALNDELGRLGFLHEDREPLYQDFLKALQAVEYADRPVMRPEELRERHEKLMKLVASLRDARADGT